MEQKSAWEREQQLGVATIESEHQLQERLVAVLRDAVASGRDQSVVSEILRRVEDTSNVHFMSEELLMRLEAFEDYGQHVEEHRKLLAQLAELRERFEADPGIDLGPSIGWIEGWLSNHVRQMDRRFAESVLKQKSGVT